ncbi:hypothetical protein BVX98_02905 [bacterium F11]|nr:hypothetical protein BVX98_02905 [bacterium F11]
MVFSTNSLLAHAPEANRGRRPARPAGGQAGFWKERQKQIQMAALRLPSPTYQQNPSFPSPSIPSPVSKRKIQKWLKNKPSEGRLKDVLSILSGPRGTIRDISFPKDKTADPIVIHIQDIHMNQEAQKNIGALLQDLLNKNLLDFLALEGAFKPIDLGPFRNFPHQGTVHKVADYLLQENKISGPLHTALTSADAIPAIIGVDDLVHYRANVQAVKESYPLKEKLKKAVLEREHELELEKHRIFTGDLLDFDQKVQAYRKGTIKMGDYANHLARYRADLHPTVSSFLEALRLEESLHFAQVEKERSLLLSQLIKRINKESLSLLINATVAFRMGQMNHADFYKYLYDLCKANSIDLGQFKVLNKYLQYILLAESLNAEELIQQLRRLEDSTYERLANTEKKKILVRQSREAYLVAKLIDFSLTKEEWDGYKKISPKISFMEDLVSFENFYKEAEIRDQQISGNLLTHTNTLGSKVSVLVTGGFHSKGIRDHLRGKEITTITWVPKITKVNASNGSAYLSVFTQEKTPLEKLFGGEKLFLSQPQFPQMQRHETGLHISGQSPLAILDTIDWAETSMEWEDVSITLEPNGNRNISGVYIGDDEVKYPFSVGYQNWKIQPNSSKKQKADWRSIGVALLKDGRTIPLLILGIFLTLLLDIDAAIALFSGVGSQMTDMAVAGVGLAGLPEGSKVSVFVPKPGGGEVEVKVEPKAKDIIEEFYVGDMEKPRETLGPLGFDDYYEDFSAGEYKGEKLSISDGVFPYLVWLWRNGVREVNGDNPVKQFAFDTSKVFLEKFPNSFGDAESTIQSRLQELGSLAQADFLKFFFVHLLLLDYETKGKSDSEPLRKLVFRRMYETVLRSLKATLMNQQNPKHYLENDLFDWAIGHSDLGPFVSDVHPRVLEWAGLTAEGDRDHVQMSNLEMAEVLLSLGEVGVLNDIYGRNARVEEQTGDLERLIDPFDQAESGVDGTESYDDWIDPIAAGLEAAGGYNTVQIAGDHVHPNDLSNQKFPLSLEHQLRLFEALGEELEFKTWVLLYPMEVIDPLLKEADPSVPGDFYQGLLDYLNQPDPDTLLTRLGLNGGQDLGFAAANCIHFWKRFHALKFRKSISASVHVIIQNFNEEELREPFGKIKTNKTLFRALSSHMDGGELIRMPLPVRYLLIQHLVTINELTGKKIIPSHVLGIAARNVGLANNFGPNQTVAINRKIYPRIKSFFDAQDNMLDKNWAETYLSLDEDTLIFVTENNIRKGGEGSLDAENSPTPSDAVDPNQDDPDLVPVNGDNDVGDPETPRFPSFSSRMVSLANKLVKRAAVFGIGFLLINLGLALVGVSDTNLVSAFGLGVTEMSLASTGVAGMPEGSRSIVFIPRSDGRKIEVRVDSEAKQIIDEFIQGDIENPRETLGPFGFDAYAADFKNGGYKGDGVPFSDGLFPYLLWLWRNLLPLEDLNSKVVRFADLMTDTFFGDYPNRFKASQRQTAKRIQGLGPVAQADILKFFFVHTLLMEFESQESRAGGPLRGVVIRKMYKLLLGAMAATLMKYSNPRDYLENELFDWAIDHPDLGPLVSKIHPEILNQAGLTDQSNLDQVASHNINVIGTLVEILGGVGGGILEDVFGDLPKIHLQIRNIARLVSPFQSGGNVPIAGASLDDWNNPLDVSVAAAQKYSHVVLGGRHVVDSDMAQESFPFSLEYQLRLFEKMGTQEYTGWVLFAPMEVIDPLYKEADPPVPADFYQGLLNYLDQNDSETILTHLGLNGKSKLDPPAAHSVQFWRRLHQLKSRKDHPALVHVVIPNFNVTDMGGILEKMDMRKILFRTPSSGMYDGKLTRIPIPIKHLYIQHVVVHKRFPGSPLNPARELGAAVKEVANDNHYGPNQTVAISRNVYPQLEAYFDQQDNLISGDWKKENISLDQDSLLIVTNNKFRKGGEGQVEAESDPDPADSVDPTQEDPELLPVNGGDDSNDFTPGDNPAIFNQLVRLTKRISRWAAVFGLVVALSYSLGISLEIVEAKFGVPLALTPMAVSPDPTVVHAGFIGTLPLGIVSWLIAGWLIIRWIRKWIHGIMLLPGGELFESEMQELKSTAKYISNIASSMLEIDSEEIVFHQIAINLQPAIVFLNHRLQNIAAVMPPVLSGDLRDVAIRIHWATLGVYPDGLEKVKTDFLIVESELLEIMSRELERPEASPYKLKGFLLRIIPAIVVGCEIIYHAGYFVAGLIALLVGIGINFGSYRQRLESFSANHLLLVMRSLVGEAREISQLAEDMRGELDKSSSSLTLRAKSRFHRKVWSFEGTIKNTARAFPGMWRQIEDMLHSSGHLKEEWKGGIPMDLEGLSQVRDAFFNIASSLETIIQQYADDRFGKDELVSDPEEPNPDNPPMLSIQALTLSLFAFVTGIFAEEFALGLVSALLIIVLHEFVAHPLGMVLTGQKLRLALHGGVTTGVRSIKGRYDHDTHRITVALSSLLPFLVGIFMVMLASHFGLATISSFETFFLINTLTTLVGTIILLTPTQRLGLSREASDADIALDHQLARDLLFILNNTEVELGLYNQTVRKATKRIDQRSFVSAFSQERFLQGLLLSEEEIIARLLEASSLLSQEERLTDVRALPSQITRNKANLMMVDQRDVPDTNQFLFETASYLGKNGRAIVLATSEVFYKSLLKQNINHRIEVLNGQMSEAFETDRTRLDKLESYFLESGEAPPHLRPIFEPRRSLNVIRSQSVPRESFEGLKPNSVFRSNGTIFMLIDELLNLLSAVRAPTYRDIMVIGRKIAISA